MLKNDDRIELVKKLITDVFLFLEKDFFYQRSYIYPDSEIFSASLDVQYINQIKRRFVTISYTQQEVNEEVKHTFSLSIKRIPYSGLEDFFGLDIYRRSIGEQFTASVLNNFNLDQVEQILMDIQAAVKRHTLAIIDGTIWLETFYPRKD